MVPKRKFHDKGLFNYTVKSAVKDESRCDKFASMCSEKRAMDLDKRKLTGEKGSLLGADFTTSERAASHNVAILVS